MKNNYRDRIYKNYLASIFRKNGCQSIAEEYEMHYRYFRKNYLPFMPLDKSARILDAGCGLGHFLNAAIKLRHKNTVGVDISEELVEICKMHGLPAIKSDIADYLRENRRSFDAIVLNDVIEHLSKEEIILTLDLVYEALKPGGVLLVKTLNMNNPFTAAAGRYIDFTHEVGFTESSLREIIHITNFCDIKIIGTDIYIYDWNPLNYIIKFMSFIFSKSFYLISSIYGRNTLKIYNKDILAIAFKKSDE